MPAGGATAYTYAPQPPTTKQIRGVPCSVTERGPVFSIVNGSYMMKYGGGVSCAGGVGERTLDVAAQVAKYLHGKNIWFNISLSGLYQGPTGINPLRLSTGRSAYLGHTPTGRGPRTGHP
jgi:hypothetical protein